MNIDQYQPGVLLDEQIDLTCTGYISHVPPMLVQDPSNRRILPPFPSLSSSLTKVFITCCLSVGSGPKQQTDPPSIPVAELFPDKNFPEGEIQEYVIPRDAKDE